MKIMLKWWTLVISLALFLSCHEKNEKRQFLFGQNNAVWSEAIYFRGYRPSTKEPLTLDRLKKFAKTLKKNNIRYAYLFAGPYGEDGHLPAYAYSETAVKSVKLIQKYYPELIILPWIGGIQNKTVYLNDSVWVTRALEDTKRLIDVLNVAGVHVDFEYAMPGNPFLDAEIKERTDDDYEVYGNNVNDFHKHLRELIPEAFISSVVVATSPGTEPWKRKTTMEELKVLTRYIDQLSFLYYDTSIDDQKKFEENCYSLIKDIQTLKALNDIQYLIAIGTFINAPELQSYRNLTIESIPNSLSTIKEQISLIDTSQQLINGISIYCDWFTDEDEWNQFRTYWAR